MKLITQQEAYVLIIIFFVFLGCSLVLTFKREETLSIGKSIWVQFVAWCFGSLILTGAFLGWEWNKWFVWVLGIPTGLYSARALRLIFEQAENSKDLIDLINNVWAAYKAVKDKGNPQ